MTWLGKIFAFLVLVLSVAAVWLIATGWVTRTNWRVQALEYKAEYNKVLAARQAEYDAYRSEVEALKGQIVTLKTDLSSAQAARDESDRENKTNRDNANKANLALSSLSKTLTDGETAIQVALKKADEALTRSVQQEAQIATLTVTTNGALLLQTAADSARRRAEAIADAATRQNEELRNEVAALKGSGPGGSVPLGGGTVPVPESLRGTVTHVQDKDPQTGIQGELVQISIGLDAGLRRGAELELSRTEGGGKYLGTLVIDSVWPKYAVGVFVPAGGKPLRRLKADEFPKVGDTVKVKDGNRTTAIGGGR